MTFEQASRAAQIHQAHAGSDIAPHDPGDDGDGFGCFDCDWTVGYDVPADDETWQTG